MYMYLGICVVVQCFLLFEIEDVGFFLFNVSNKVQL